MELPLLFRRITRKHLVAVLLISSGVLLGVIYNDDTPETVYAPAVVEGKPSAKSTPPPGRMPIGFEPGRVLRDPFALPGQFAPLQPVGEQASPTAVRSVPAAKAATVKMPVLMGVVGAGEQWAAIIRLGDESRSYQLHEYAGSYQVVAITIDSATVAGPAGVVVLRVGR